MTVESAYRARRDELSLLRWVWGWHPIVGWVMVAIILAGIGYYLELAYELALVGLVLGGPIWYQGMRYINEHAEDLAEAYLEDVDRFGPKVLQEAGCEPDAEIYTFVETPEKTLPFIETVSKVEVVMIAVGEDAVWIYDDSKLDLMFLNLKMTLDPIVIRRFPYRALERITYGSGSLELVPDGTIEEDVYQRALSEEPTDLIETVRERMASP